MIPSPRAIASLALAAGLSPALAGGPLLLDANFDGEPLDQPIGTNGPPAQPIHVDQELSAVVRASATSPALELGAVQTGMASTLRFGFAGQEEVLRGDLEVAFSFRVAQADAFKLMLVRERDTSMHRFLDIDLQDNGSVWIEDDGAEPSLQVGSIVPGIDHRIVAIFHLDERSFDVSFDGVPVVLGRVHGIEPRGIGSLLAGTGQGTAIGSTILLDEISVRRGDRIHHDGFE